MSDGFEIDYKLLPPKLQMQLWVLGLDANTSHVALAYKAGAFTTNLTYNYGGNVDAAFAMRRLTLKVSVNPSSGDMSESLVFRGFRFGATQGYGKATYGGSFGYGADLLPFPGELSDTFNSAEHGLQTMSKDIAAAPDNPLKWYKLHSNDAAAIGKAVGLGQQIAKQGKGDSFGVGLTLKHAPETGLTIMGGAQFSF